MKIAVLLLFAVGGYHLWSHFSVPPPAAKPSNAPEVQRSAAQPPVTPAPVDFNIKMRVRRILEEWKKQSLAESSGQTRTSMLDIKAELAEIRRRLFDQGLHDEQSMKETMVRAAVELGYPRDQAEHLVDQVLGRGNK